MIISGTHTKPRFATPGWVDDEIGEGFVERSHGLTHVLVEDKEGMYDFTRGLDNEFVHLITQGFVGDFRIRPRERDEN